MGLIPINAIEEKVRNLEDFLSDVTEFDKDFASLFLTKLSSFTMAFLTPEHYALKIELTLYNLQHGINGLTGKFIKGESTMLPEREYISYRYRAIEVVGAIISPETSGKVREVYAVKGIMA